MTVVLDPIRLKHELRETVKEARSTGMVLQVGKSHFKKTEKLWLDLIELANQSLDMMD